VVLSAYSESPQHAKPPDSPDPTEVTVCSNNNSAQLGILAPVLPQNEVFVSLLPQNGVFILPQNEVLKSVPANCQLFCNLKIIVDLILDAQMKVFMTLDLHFATWCRKIGFYYQDCYGKPSTCFENVYLVTV